MAPSAVRKAEGQLALLCELHNGAIEERKWAWKQRVSIGFYDQCRQLKDIKRDRPEFAVIGAQVLEGALRRVDLAFRAFYRRCKAGQTPGYPRFKPRFRYDSLTFRKCGWKLQGRRLTMQGIGTVRLCLSRPIEGRVKTVTLRRDTVGDWWVAFCCEGVVEKPLAQTGKSVGVDLGLSNFLATSDGELVANPRPLIAEDAKRRRLQRAISRQTKGGKNRRKRGRILARQLRRVARVRADFHHKTARSFVRRYDTIAIEDLNVVGLSRSRLARSVSDAGWGDFTRHLADKVEETGRLLIRVNPSGTSQVCSGCAVEVRKTLADRVHSCPACGLVLDRDVNASRNILALAIQGEAHPLASRPRSKVAA